MDVIDAIKTRRSVRHYKAEKPNRELLTEVLEAGRLAPSACNKQPWRFVCLTGGAKTDEVRKAYERDWINSVTTIIVVIANHTESWHRASDGKDHADVDAAIAIDHMTLRAAELGLGTCWICNFDTSIVRKALSLSDEEEPIALLPIGFPTEESLSKQRTTRKEAGEVYSFDD